MALAEQPYSARQREILATARTLLTDEGVEALTVGRIAKALAIKPPSLYKHFAGKREIEAALIAEGLQKQAEALEPAQDDLASLATAYRAFALANPQLYRLMTERPLPHDLLPRGLEARAAAPLLKAAGDADLSRALHGFLHGMVTLELSGRFPPWAKLDRAWQKGILALNK
jgi:AcrR family transcriptional regulator